MSSSEEKKKITLVSSDGPSFEIDEAEAMPMETIKHIIEDECSTDPIPVPNVHSRVLSKVIEYCKRHFDLPENSENQEVKAFDGELVSGDRKSLFELVQAANYLNIKNLLNLTLQSIAEKIKGKTPEEVREFFHIENDFTPEEEAKIRAENSLAFEPEP